MNSLMAVLALLLPLVHGLVVLTTTRRASPTMALVAEEEGCVITTLDHFASTVLGKQNRAEAFICPISDGDDADVARAREEHDCAQVMHEGELVWACRVAEDDPPPQNVVWRDWKSPDEYSDLWQDVPQAVVQQSVISSPSKKKAKGKTPDSATLASDDIVDGLFALLGLLILGKLFGN